MEWCDGLSRKIALMPRKPRPDSYKRTTISMPEHVHASIQAAAEHNGRTANDEMVARLVAPEDERFAALERQLEEVKGMLRKLLDAAG